MIKSNVLDKIKSFSVSETFERYRIAICFWSIAGVLIIFGIMPWLVGWYNIIF